MGYLRPLYTAVYSTSHYQRMLSSNARDRYMTCIYIPKNANNASPLPHFPCSFPFLCFIQSYLVKTSYSVPHIPRGFPPLPRFCLFLVPLASPSANAHCPPSSLLVERVKVKLHYVASPCGTSWPSPPLRSLGLRRRARVGVAVIRAVVDETPLSVRVHVRQASMERGRSIHPLRPLILPFNLTF